MTMAIIILNVAHLSVLKAKFWLCSRADKRNTTQVCAGTFIYVRESSTLLARDWKRPQRQQYFTDRRQQA